MIYHLPHTFRFLNFRLRHFANISVFAILRTFPLITREIYVETTNKAHHFNPLIELVLMMCIHISFIKQFLRYTGTSENPNKATNGQSQKIKVKTEGPIVFLCFVYYLSLAVQQCIFHHIHSTIYIIYRTMYNVHCEYMKFTVDHAF